MIEVQVRSIREMEVIDKQVRLISVEFNHF